MINILEIPKQKAVNNNIVEVNEYDYKTFKQIAESSACLKKFNDVVWNDTFSTRHIKFNTMHKGLVKFDYKKDFEFYNYFELEKKIKDRIEKFESINWKITNQLQYISATELYLWEVWLKQIEYIDLAFVENGC